MAVLRSTPIDASLIETPFARVVPALGERVLPESRPARKPASRSLAALREGDVERAQARDRDAFERLYRLRIGPISRYIAAIVRDAMRAEDVTAQTFLLAWRDLPGLRQPERFDAWLFRIAHNQAISEVTRRRATTPLDDAPEPADEGRFGAPDRELDHAADVEALRHAIDDLPATQREVLLLRYFGEMSPGEIAAQIGKNEQSVWALTHRALKNLKRSMAAHHA